jgi:hypothetical protein
MAFLGRFCLKSDATRVAAVDKATRGLVFNAMEAIVFVISSAKA